MVSDFHGTEFEIWFGLGRLAALKKKLERLWTTFEDSFFKLSWAKKIFKIVLEINM